MEDENEEPSDNVDAYLNPYNSRFLRIPKYKNSLELLILYFKFLTTRSIKKTTMSSTRMR